jgi:competence protein ComEA
MGLLDRDYMRCLPSFERPPNGGGSGWQKYLWIATVAIGVASAGFYLYKNVHENLSPDEGDLIVNVNNATLEELETIPGIGPVLARQIIAERPYARVEDLERARGIGPYTVNSIRPYVKVEGDTEKR